MEIDKESSLLKVEAAYGAEARQLIIPPQVSVGTTEYEAIRLFKVETELAEINIDEDTIGIFSKILGGKSRPNPKEYKLQDKDRVEIYRALMFDPNEARLKRAAQKRRRMVSSRCL